MPFIPKVLIVNDDVHSAVAFQSALAEGITNKDFEVVLAYSGEDALRHLLKSEFAVVLLDIKMPIMDGFETAEAIHSNLRLASLPIIFVTAYYDDDFHRLQAYRNGAVDYVFMPVNPKILQTKVSIFVEIARQRHALELRANELRAINDRLHIRQLAGLGKRENLLADETPTNRERSVDPGTGLLTRQSLTEHLEHAIGYASHYRECFALLVVEIDAPDDLGDAASMTAGNLLNQVAHSIRLSVRISDLVARTEETRFAVLLKGIAGFSEAAQVAAKVAMTLSQGYRVENDTLEIDFNIGLAMYPQDGMSAEGLLNGANEALYPGKQFVLN